MKPSIIITGKCSTVSVVADSLNPDGKRLTTLQLRYPRILHAEFMTHRVFSRNASSSRAIPVSRMNKGVREDPATPIHWGANQKGMQAGADIDEGVVIPPYLRKTLHHWNALEHGLEPGSDAALALEAVSTEEDGSVVVSARVAWKFSTCLMAGMSDAYDQAGYHKQVANRLTEFAQWMSVVLTTTEYQNFLDLRDHHMAYPEIQDLAKSVKSALALSTPKPLAWGHYHLPYSMEDDERLTLYGRLMCSTARCARVSYDRHDGEANSHTADFELYQRLVGEVPQHYSPAEHPAVALRGQYANFNGFASLRWMLERKIRVLPSDGGEGV